MQETLQNHNALLNDLPESLGATLTRARLSRKLETREAASRIGVDASVIQALEDDDFQHLGAPVFARNFLTRYSRLLELPEQDILERFRQMGLDEPPPLKVERPIQRQARMTDIRWLAYPVVVVGVMWLSYLGFERLNVHYSSSTAQSLPTEATGDATTAPPPSAVSRTSKSGSSANPMAPALAAIADLTGFDSLRGEDEDVQTAETPSADTPASASDETETPDASVDSIATSQPDWPGDTPATTDLSANVDEDVIDPAGDAVTDSMASESGDLPEEDTPLVAVANLGGSLDDDDPLTDEASSDLPLADLPTGHYQLVLNFSDDCWVEVRDASGERLVRSILNANTANRYVGEAPFSLTLGNAAAVTSITLNGEPVDTSVYSPTRGNVSRFTLEAPSG